jgi:Ni,Fe-hydrogenase III large subunit
MGSMINIGSCNVSNSGDSGFDNPNMTVNYRRNFDSGPNQMNHAPIIMSRSQKNLGGMTSNRAKPVSTLVLPPASRTSGVDSITSASKSHNSHRTRTQNS